MAAHERATIYKYCRSLFKGMGRILSGSLTVIPGYAGQYILPAYGQEIWIGTALAAVIIWSYQARAEEYNKRVALEESAQPKIEIIDISQHQIPSSSPMTRVYDLVIKNVGSQTLGDCLIKVIGIDQKAIEPKILRTSGQIQGAREGRFNLSPGETKHVPLCSRKVMYLPPTKTPMTMDFEGATLGFELDSPIIFEVAVYSSAPTTYIKIEMSIDNGNALLVRTIPSAVAT